MDRKGGKNGSLTTKQKQDLKRKHEENPRMTQENLKKWVKSEFNVDIDRSTVSKILNTTKIHDEESTVKEPERKRMRTVKFPELDSQLKEWFVQMENITTITDAMLIKKGKEIAENLNISKEDLCFSSGWLEKFKSRHRIKSYQKFGEAASVDETAVEKEIANLRDEIENYNPKGIYNFGETGLFYRMEPDTTLATQRISGRKMNEERIMTIENEEAIEDIDRSTVSKILNTTKIHDEESTVKEPDRKRMRTVKFPELDSQLKEWFLRMENITTITDAMLIEKGKEIAENLKISKEDLCFSSGWLEKFKSRHRIKSYRKFGEAASVDETAVEKEIANLQDEIENYNPKGIYNFGETGLFYRMEPDTTLATQRISGRKKNKESITTTENEEAIEEDMDETEEPLVISHSDAIEACEKILLYLQQQSSEYAMDVLNLQQLKRGIIYNKSASQKQTLINDYFKKV